MMGRLAPVLLLVIAILLFGAAMAFRAEINPWLSNATIAAGVVLACHKVVRAEWQGVAQLGARPVIGAVVLGVVLVLGTHAAFAGLAATVPGWLAQVDVLYAEITSRSFGLVFTLAIIALVVVAEELVWRGLAIDLLSRRWAPTAAGAGAVVLCAVPQGLAGVWLLALAALGLGTVFTWQRMQTRSLVPGLVTHFMWSASIFGLFPLR